MEGHWEREGYARTAVIDRGYFFLVVWRNEAGNPLPQPLNKDDAAGLARLRAAMLGAPRRRRARRR
jgi:hypothetical protein